MYLFLTFKILTNIINKYKTKKPEFVKKYDIIQI